MTKVLIFQSKKGAPLATYYLKLIPCPLDDNHERGHCLKATTDVNVFWNKAVFLSITLNC